MLGFKLKTHTLWWPWEAMLQVFNSFFKHPGSHASSTACCTVLQLGLHWCGSSAALYAAMRYIVPLLRIYLAALSVLELEYVCVLIILLIYIPLLLLIYICYSCRFLLLG